MHFISDFTQKAVIEVYSTMLKLRAEPVSAQEAPNLPPAQMSGVVSSVGFAGKINGALYMHYNDSLACRVTENLLGSKPASSGDAEVGDVLGELSNMVAGQMKGHTSKLGYHGWLATPLLMRGENVVVESNDAPIAIYNRFRIPELNEELGVWVFAKLENP